MEHPWGDLEVPAADNRGKRPARGPSRSPERPEDIIIRHLDAAEALLATSDMEGEPQRPQSSCRMLYDPVRESQPEPSRASSSKRAAACSGQAPSPKRQVPSECAAAAAGPERPVPLAAEVADYISAQLRDACARVADELEQTIAARVARHAVVRGLLHRMLAVEARLGHPAAGEGAELRRAVFGELQKQELLLGKIEDRVSSAERAIDHAREDVRRLEASLGGLRAEHGRLDEVASRVEKLEAAAGVNVEIESLRRLVEDVLDENARLRDACGPASCHDHREAAARARAGDMEEATKQQRSDHGRSTPTSRTTGSVRPNEAPGRHAREGHEDLHELTGQGSDSGQVSHDADDCDYPLLKRWLAMPRESVSREHRDTHALLLNLGLDKLLAGPGGVGPDLPGLVPAMESLLRTRRRMRRLEQACIDEENKLRDQLENEGCIIVATL